MSKTLNIEGRQVPQPSYEYEAGRLVRSYKRAMIQIKQEIHHTDLTNFQKAQRYALLRNIDSILKELDSEARTWTKEFIGLSTRQGAASALVSLGYVDDLEAAKKVVKFNQLNENLVKTAIADTHEDLLAITKNMRQEVVVAIRQVAAEVIRENIPQGYGRRTLSREMSERIEALKGRLEDAADTAIVKDAAGRKWRTEAYTDMYARTKLMDIHTTATTNEAVGRGAKYAIISTNPRTKDACKWHEGRIVKLDPNAEGNFMTVDEIKASGQIFHPNCKHHILPFRRFDRLSKTQLEKAEQQEMLGRSAQEVGGRKPITYKVRRGRGDFHDPNRIPQTKPIVKELENPIEKAKEKAQQNKILDNYRPANTVKGANEWAKAFLPIKKVDYAGYDLQLANEMNRQLGKLLDDYPEVRNIKYVGTAQNRNKGSKEVRVQKYFERLRKNPKNDQFSDAGLMKYAQSQIKMQRVPKNVYAQAANHTWGDFEGVTWNKEWAKDYEKIRNNVTNDAKAKWHPIGTDEPTSVITHEFGHMVDYFLRANAPDLHEKHVKPRVDELLSRGRNYVGDNLSRYAYTNDYEIIAEAFAEYHHNPNPRIWAKNIVGHMHRALEEYRERS